MWRTPDGRCTRRSSTARSPGSIAQGIGGALYEHLVYDDDGNLSTGTLLDYLMPTSAEIPELTIGHVARPAANPLGVRGVGEGGTLGPNAVLAGAVLDAVGVEIDTLPITPAVVWEAVNPVKAAPFEYVRAGSVDEVVTTLRWADGDGKILAGGQSLVPVLALRMARPTVLVDVNRLPGMVSVRPDSDAVEVGALVRHAHLAAQDEHPLLAEAASWIGHTAIRTRGTVGGSLAHADPSAELPAVAVALGATVTVAGGAGVCARWTPRTCSSDRS